MPAVTGSILPKKGLPEAQSGCVRTEAFQPLVELSMRTSPLPTVDFSQETALT